jgi:carboxylesterase
MDYLGRYLHEKGGYTVSIPRLPGHATDRADFLSTGSRDWLRRVRDAYYDLRAEYEDISICGLSMGGLLALILAAETDCRAAALAAPAVKAHSQIGLTLSPLLRFFLKPRKNKNTEHEFSEETEPELFYLENELYHWLLPYSVSQLRVLQKKAYKALPKISVPTLIIVSEKDMTVPPEAAEIIRKGMAKNPNPPKIVTEIFKESPHVIVNGPEKEKAASRILDFLQDL